MNGAICRVCAESDASPGPGRELRTRRWRDRLRPARTDPDGRGVDERGWKMTGRDHRDRRWQPADRSNRAGARVDGGDRRSLTVRGQTAGGVDRRAERRDACVTQALRQARDRRRRATRADPEYRAREPRAREAANECASSSFATMAVPPDPTNESSLKLRWTPRSWSWSVGKSQSWRPDWFTSRMRSFPRSAIRIAPGSTACGSPRALRGPRRGRSRSRA
jgi:hypothetical protein